MNTLLQIAQDACVEVEWTDSNAEKAAKKGIRYWYKYLWMEHNWRDSMVVFEMDATAAVEEDLPDGVTPVGKVYDIPCEDVLFLSGKDVGLTPSNILTELQKNPKALQEGYGYSIAVLGAGKESGTRRIRIMESPQSDALGLLVVGKKSCPLLDSDTDTPLIYGIDLALEKFAIGALLRKRRQYSKAKAILAEAKHIAETIFTKEKEQASYSQQIVPEDTYGYCCEEDLIGGAY